VLQLPYGFAPFRSEYCRQFLFKQFPQKFQWRASIQHNGKREYKYWRNAIMTDIIILNAGIIAVLIGLLLPAVQKVR